MMHSSKLHFTIGFIATIIVVSLLWPSPVLAQSPEPELAGKKWVIEGVWRGYNALYRDSVVLVHRVIPRNHDYIEFFEDSTFHFNYFSQTTGTGLEQYQKNLWAPGTWKHNTISNQLQMFFTDDRVTQYYKLVALPENTLILYNERPENKRQH